MGACTYVGRVGGLAVTLGVGAAVLGGTATAWANEGADDGPSAGRSDSAQANPSSTRGAGRGGPHSPAGTRGPAGTRPAGAPRGADAELPWRRLQPVEVAASDDSGPMPDGSNVIGAPVAAAAAIPDSVPTEIAAAGDISQDPGAAAAAVGPAEVSPAVPASVESVPVTAILPVESAAAEPVNAPASAPVASVLTAAATALSDLFVGDDTGVPVDSALDWTMLAFSRRNPLSAASIAQPAAVTAPTLPLILGPSGVPIPSPAYGEVVMDYYVTPNSPDGTLPQQLIFTPEGLYPITGVKSLPLNTSVDQGIQILYDSLAKLPAGTTATVFGYSQSAIIASLLQGGYTVTIDDKPVKFTVPSDLDVSFIMVGDEMNPNGGFLSRFSGRDMPMFSLTSLGIPFYGATPGGEIPEDGGPIQTYYDTTVYTREYDGFADFPRYPLNFLSVLNAGLGIVFVHTKYAPIPSPPATHPCTSYCLTQEEVANAIALPSSLPDTQHYFFIPTENLPLLEPLRLIPLIGKPLAALIQPVLKVIVDLGYADPAHGFSSATQPFANELVPFGVFPKVDPGEVFGQLIDGVKQGVQDFLHELGPDGSLAQEISAFSLPGLSPGSLGGSGDFIKTVQTLITAFADYVSGATASLYSGLLPTADIINSILTTLPAYNVNLFLYGIQQAFSGELIEGLINSVGLPLAADVGLVTTAGLVGALVWAQAVSGALPSFSFG